MSSEEKKAPFIINHEVPFVSAFFISYMQPFFYHKDLTIEETMSEWQHFGEIYQKTKSLNESNVFFTVEMEKELDNYYKNHPKLSELYFDRKVELNIREQQITGERVQEPLILKDFHMPEREFFEKAKAICEYASLKSLRMTYTGYNNFSEGEKNYGLNAKLNNLYSTLNYSINEAFKQNNIGLGCLNINIIDRSHFNFQKVCGAEEYGSFISALETIQINYPQKENPTSTFLHEYTHFLEHKYCSIFKSDMEKSGRNPFKYDTFDKYEINATLSKITGYRFSFSSYNSTGKNNKLYKIINTAFYEQHADFIKDYDDIIYLNITGKPLNRIEMKQDLLSRNYKHLFEPVSRLIEEGVIIDTTVDHFITQNEDFLNDFISSLRYHIFHIDRLLDNHDNAFTQLISLQKFMKYQLDLTHINPEITQEKLLHSILKVMIEVDRKISEQLDAEGNDSATPLYERIHDYYPTVDLFIPEKDFREETRRIFYFGYIENIDVTYMTLACELLAFSMTENYDQKPEYIKKANQQFYSKYINYIAEKLSFEIRSFDKDIINNLNILSEKQLLTDNVQTIQPAKVVAPSI